ncbi:Bifunctional aspartokinase/homoserine dehydrogenase 1 [Pleodorina starrii]|nr:Bifunctional aspartokinase/homoserine dehydrogenase 1 [Pleodorina starrii]
MSCSAGSNAAHCDVPGMRFSEVVADAKARGYTEPDPRDDLSGLDVARKVVILARECGLDVELGGIQVDSLVPEPLRGKAGMSAETFMEALPQHDDAMAARAAEAAAAGGVVRYVGCVDMEAGTAGVTLHTYPSSHPFAQLSGSDNMVVFTTLRYHDRPLIVRGPGAGAEATAAGVFVDLLQVIRSHPRA